MENIKQYLLKNFNNCYNKEGFKNLEEIYNKNSSAPIFNLINLFIKSSIIAGILIIDKKNEIEIFIKNPVIKASQHSLCKVDIWYNDRGEYNFQCHDKKYPSIENLFNEKIIFNDDDEKILYHLKLGWEFKNEYNTAVKHISGLEYGRKLNYISYYLGNSKIYNINKFKNYLIKNKIYRSESD